MKIVNTLNPSTNDLFVGRNEIFDKLKGLFLLNHTKKAACLVGKRFAGRTSVFANIEINLPGTVLAYSNMACIRYFSEHIDAEILTEICHAISSAMSVDLSHPDYSPYIDVDCIPSFF